MVAKPGARAGAAAFVLGLSVAGPAGFAAADTPDSESGSAQAAAGESAVQTAPARRHPSEQAESFAGFAAPPPRQPPNGCRANRGRGPSQPVMSGRTTPAPAAATRPAGLTAAARSSVSAPTAAATRRPVTAALGSAAAVGNTDRPERSAVVPVAPAASVTAASRRRRQAGQATAQPAGAEAFLIAAAVTTAVNHAFNSAFDWLASLPPPTRFRPRRRGARPDPAGIVPRA